MNEPVNKWEDDPAKADDWDERSTRLLRTLSSLLLYVGIYFLVFRDLKSILLLVLVIIVHEGGHFLAMKVFGYTDIRLFFIPFFGAFVSGRNEDVPAFRKALMVLAGPLPGILIGLILLFLYGSMGHSILYMVGLMFLLLNVFNLLPVKPLDGGQLLFTLFPRAAIPVQALFTVLAALAVGALALSGRDYWMLGLAMLLMVRVVFQASRNKVRNRFFRAHLDPGKPIPEWTDAQRARALEIFHMEKPSEDGHPSTAYLEEEVILQGMNRYGIRAPGPPATLAQQLTIALLWLLGLLSPLLALFNYTNGRFLAE